MGEQGNPATGRNAHRHRRIQLLRAVNNAQAVGADQPYAVGLRNGAQLLLQGCPCRTGFGKPAAEHHHDRHPCCRTVAQDGRRAPGRGDHNRQVNRLRHVSHRGVGGQTHDRYSARVYGHHLRVRVAQQVVHQQFARLAFFLRRANQRNTAWAEGRLTPIKQRSHVASPWHGPVNSAGSPPEWMKTTAPAPAQVGSAHWARKPAKALPV